jgi:hypothetical protein
LVFEPTTIYQRAYSLTDEQTDHILSSGGCAHFSETPRCSVRYADALLSGGTFAAFAHLSQSERFQRKWPSLYAAVEDRQIDTEVMYHLLISQFPQKGICIFPLDELSWARPRSLVPADWRDVHQLTVRSFFDRI